MELLESQEASEKDTKSEDTTSPCQKTRNEVKRKRKFKNPKVLLTNGNQENWEEILLNLPLTLGELSEIQREFTETKEWIKDFIDCQTFVREHKLLKRSSDSKKRVIRKDQENSLEINSIIKEELILRKNLDSGSSQIVNINMAENNRAFSKGEKNKIKFFNDRPPKEDIWKYQPRSTLNYRDSKHWDEEMNKGISRELPRNWSSKNVGEEKIIVKKDVAKSKGFNKYIKPRGRYVNDKGYVKETERESYKYNSEYVGIYSGRDEGGLKKFTSDLSLAENDIVPKHMIRKDEDGDIITYVDSTGRFRNYEQPEEESFPDLDEQATWRWKIKMREWEEDFKQCSNANKRVDWLFNKFCTQAEIQELAGARVMKVEDNIQKAVSSMAEELELRPTKDQINSQLVAERTASKSFVIKNTMMTDNFWRESYDEKKRLLADRFTTATNQIKTGTRLTESLNIFSWAEQIRNIRQLKMRNMGNQATNVTIELDDHVAVHDMFLAINRWRSQIRERGRPGEDMRHEAQKALDIIKDTIGTLVPCEPESFTKTQKSKYELRSKCNELNKQDFNAKWGPNNYEGFRSCEPGKIWEKTSGFMKIFKGNELLGKDDEINFVFKTSFKDMATYEYQYNVHMAHMTNQWREKVASIAKDRQNLEKLTTEAQEQGQNGAKDPSVSKQKMREYLEREEHIWRGTPGPNKLDSNGRPFVQSRTTNLSGGVEKTSRTGGGNLAGASSTITENHGLPNDSKQAFINSQQNRGKWEPTRHRQPKYHTQGYNHMSPGQNHQGGFRGDGEDVRHSMQKFGPQRSTNGQYYHKDYPQNWNSRGGYHKGSGGRPDHYPMTMQDSYGRDPFEEDF